jgi:predicted RNase H-like nuclease (RuvC/YqgF family)
MAKTLRKLETGADKLTEINHYKEWVESLPEDTYLYMMFKGTELEVEQQIANDFGQNWMDRVQELYEMVEDAKQAVKETKQAKEHWESRFGEREQELLSELNYQRNVIDAQKEEQRRQHEEISRLKEAVLEQEKIILKLKAKLYDLQNPEG